MSDEEACFPFTWEIENFDNFRRAGDGELSSPTWKTETTEENEVEWQVLAFHFDAKVYFRLICLNATWNPDRCESSISYCGKILPTLPECSVFTSVFLSIYKAHMIINEMKSIIPLNCLTVECKMWRNSMKSGGFRIHSVVKKVLFCWCLEDPLFLSPSSHPFSHNKIIEKDNIRINMSLDSKGKNDEYGIALAITIIDGCFSFVYCNVVCDCTMAKKTRNCADIKYNDLRTEYKERWIVKQSGVTRNASCQFSFQLDTIVAYHDNSQYQITHPTSSAIAKIGGSSETVNDTLRIDLLQLYRDGVLSDATINTEGKSFSVHRSILAARSPVFRVMFEKDEMSEGRSGVVDIDDVDSETVDRMLVFLYGDSLQGLEWGEAASLYYAADKYAIQPLKKKCADILKAGLTVDNVCDALILADTHSDEQMMKNVTDFIYDHQEVVSSPKFEQLEDIKPRLTSKVTKELFLKRGKK